MPPSPQYGPHDDDSTVEEFLELTYGAVFWRDPEELAKIGGMAHAYAKVTKVFTVGGLLLADRDAHTAALAFALDGPEIAGTLSFILKYLGRKGLPHVTPGEGACALMRLPSCACLHARLPDAPRARRAFARSCRYGQRNWLPRRASSGQEGKYVRRHGCWWLFK